MARRPNVRVEAKRLPFNASKAERDRAAVTLLRIFKRACNEAGVMSTFKEHEFFIRPTDVKRRKRMNKIRGAARAEEEKTTKKEKKDYNRG
jgi:ribosomal protein S21